MERRRSALMQARPAVARFTVGEPPGRSLPSVAPLADVQVDVLAFQRLNEAFDVCVVVRVGRPPHRAAQSGLRQALAVPSRGILDAAIGMK